MNKNNLLDTLFILSTIVFSISVLGMAYSYNIINRSTCVVCGNSPPCLTGEKCRGKTFEGKFFEYYRGY